MDSRDYDSESDLDILTDIESKIDMSFLSILQIDRANLIIIRELLRRIEALEKFK